MNTVRLYFEIEPLGEHGLIFSFADALRSALIRGGVTLEALDVCPRSKSFSFSQWRSNMLTVSTGCLQLLVKPDQAEVTTANDSIVSTDAGVPLFERPRPGQPIPIRPPTTQAENQYYTGNQQNLGGLNSPTWNHAPFAATQDTNAYPPKNYHGKPSPALNSPRMDFISDQQTVRNGPNKRTVFLTKLPDRITYAKIFQVIRGGAIVDVWMKPSDHAASVSFVECSAAENFYQHVRKNDIYIDGRRVSLITSPCAHLILMPS